uniref:Putative ribonuclease H-like domain-containing protein n=1 Tax=Tanacetum cinerariifolium TaxID=118510 RepID=A0A6L2KXA0_TANCI|nr:putative ribonuclease H-like domain-containing protein [Tanacetum cinerariifolium]
MGSQSTQTITLPILQPSEYDLWNMRIKPYLQCIDYTLWEIIENGNAPIVTKTIDGKETVIPLTSVEEKAQRRAELKARSTLLMALPNENQLKFNSHKDAKTLMQAIKNRFEETETLSLDDLFNNLKAYESVVIRTSSSTTNSYNVAFLFSGSTNNTTREVNTSQGVNTASTQDLQQIHHDDLEEMDLRWNIAMLTRRARRFLKNTGRKLDMANKERIGFDKSNSDQVEEGPTNFALMAYSSTSSSSSTNSKVSNDSNCCSSCLECVKDMKEQNEQLFGDLRTSKVSVVSYKTGLESIELNWYNAIPPPHTGNFMPPKPDLVYPSLDDSVNVNGSSSESVVEKPTVESNEHKTVRKENRAPIIEDWVSESEEEDEPKVQTVKPNFTKIVFVKPKTNRKPVEQIRKDTYRSPRENKRNWNQQISQKLGTDFEMFNKACHVCGIFDYLQNDCNNWYNKGRFIKPVWNYNQRVNHKNFAKNTHPCSKRNIVLTAVLMKSDIKSVNAVRQNFSKTTVTVNTAYPKTTLNATKSRPKHKVLDHVSRNNSASITFKGFDYVDAQGVSKSYLIDYEEVDMLPLEELKFNLFSVSQMCDKKNNVLFTDTACVVLSSDFKLTDESRVLLTVPRKDNMYSVDLKNVVPQGGLTCIFAKATSEEYTLWHKRIRHVNFKTINKLVKGNLVRGLPSKLFKTNQTCVACQKGKQHRASCKTKTISSISQPLQMLHIDLFGPTFVKSLIKTMYCLVVIDDFSRFSWVFFLVTKDETSEILKTFITCIENLIDLRVKVIRCDNGTELKNMFMNQFCKIKGIKREFSVARTPQQNEVAEKKNKTLIEAARTMLADSKLLITFWAEAVNTACYVQNRVLVIKPHNNTPYELFQPVVAGNQSNGSAGTKACDNVGKTRVEKVPDKDYILLSLWTKDLPFFSSIKDSPGAGYKPLGEEEKKDTKDLGNEHSEAPITEEPRVNQEKDNVNSTNRVNAVSLTVNAASNEVNVVGRKSSIKLLDDLNMPELEDISIFEDSNEDVFDNGFQRGMIDKNLLIKKDKSDILLVQVYVDDIIFGSTKKEMCTEFEKMMHKKFQMSSIGELAFFLGMFSDVNRASTPMETHKTLLKDEKREDVDEHLYRSMIGSLMYLTSLRPDIMFEICACARFQVNPKISHLHAVKRIFRYLKGQSKLGFWFPKDSPFDLVAYTDSDYTWASLDRKSTTGGCQFLGCRLISWQCKK